MSPHITPSKVDDHNMAYNTEQAISTADMDAEIVNKNNFSDLHKKYTALLEMYNQSINDKNKGNLRQKEFEDKIKLLQKDHNAQIKDLECRLKIENDRKTNFLQ